MNLPSNTIKHIIFMMCVHMVVCSMAHATVVTEEKIEFAGVQFRVVRTTPDSIKLVWKNPSGTPYREFNQVLAEYKKSGQQVRLLMNAGIYAPGGTPCGLHIENGKTLHPLNLNPGEGNFFLKPNGVFWIESSPSHLTASIAESSFYQNHADHLKNASITLALQSGPMLLIDGKRHPAFRNGSPNKLHRNGVGIDTSGRVIFAITDHHQFVNLWDFAGLFLSLHCQNALFLDGDISRLSTTPDSPVTHPPFGAMLLIADPVKP